MDVTVEEDAQLLLNCHMWANPQVAGVSWTLNGSSVDLEESGLTISADGFYSKLSTEKAERGRHEGTYQCSMAYLSEAYTKTFHVKLTGPFPVLLPATPTFHLTVVMVCIHR